MRPSPLRDSEWNHICVDLVPKFRYLVLLLQGLADASNLPFKFVKSIQMLYELQTLMVSGTITLTHSHAKSMHEQPRASM